MLGLEYFNQLLAKAPEKKKWNTNWKVKGRSSGKNVLSALNVQVMGNKTELLPFTNLIWKFNTPGQNILSNLFLVKNQLISSTTWPSKALLTTWSQTQCSTIARWCPALGWWKRSHWSNWEHQDSGIQQGTRKTIIWPGSEKNNCCMLL